MTRIGARFSSTDSFGCALAVGGDWPRRLLAASPVLIGVAGALLAAIGQVGDMAGRAGEIVALLAVLLAAWRCRRVRNLLSPSTDDRVAAVGLLRIEHDGHIWWQADGRRASLPLQPRRWYVGRRVTWIHASVSPGAAPLHLLLWRRPVDDAAWRKLQAWLVWRERGGSRT